MYDLINKAKVLKSNMEQYSIQILRHNTEKESALDIIHDAVNTIQRAWKNLEITSSRLRESQRSFDIAKEELRKVNVIIDEKTIPAFHAGLFSGTKSIDAPEGK